MNAQTLYDKIWHDHVVSELEDGSCLLYIDRHLLHEVTSPQAFSGLHMQRRKVRRPDSCLAVEDHIVPTDPELVLDRSLAGIEDAHARKQVQALRKNCRAHGITLFEMEDVRQGIVHIVGPEQGFTWPGSTIVCGDSHTSTHGALGALAFGIGTSDVEHVLATNCLVMKKSANMQVRFGGRCGLGVSAKDMILALIGQVGIDAGTGCVIEYVGEAIDALSCEQRMTLCNMSIEAGARAGLVAVDQTTLDYLTGRPLAPSGVQWSALESKWKTLHSDEHAHYDRKVSCDVSALAPQVTWGTNPSMVIGVDQPIPNPAEATDAQAHEAAQRALDYMGLEPDKSLSDYALDRVFIGSCTNARIEDLREAAAVIQRIKNAKVANHIKQAMVVPGSGLVRKQAEDEGLDQVFIQAGFQWRKPGCSMCLAMNPDRLEMGERCASTSNRNFEGRQGRGGRTHLLSPQMAAAAAIKGHITDVREVLH